MANKSHIFPWALEFDVTGNIARKERGNEFPGNVLHGNTRAREHTHSHTHKYAHIRTYTAVETCLLRYSEICNFFYP